ncbi:MAG: DUF2793 domain-containing protein, partial [Litorimonas sp.]
SVAARRDGAWVFHAPSEGWRAWDETAGALLVFRGGAWTALPNADGSSDRVDRLGINGAADDTNRLAVASDATLLSHDGSDHRVLVNRASDADTASLIFQTDYAAEAEIGLSGASGLSVKVETAQGWVEAMNVDPGTARVSLPGSGYGRDALHNLFADGGVFGGVPEPAGYDAGPFAVPDWIQTMNGATLEHHDSYYSNSSTNGGTNAANGPDAQALMVDVISPGSARYQRGFHTARLSAGSGRGFPLSGSDGTERHLALIRRLSVVPLKMTYSLYLLARGDAIGLSVFPGTQMILDGVPTTATSLVPADGRWHHLVTRTDGDYGTVPRRDSAATRLYLAPGASLLMALPAALCGLHDLPREVGAIPSLASFSTY